jgi:hypothetical protein
MERVIPFTIDNKDVLVKKANRYINENEIKEVIEDIIENNLDFPEGKFIDLSNICDSMFSIMYKGIATIIEKINDKELYINNMVFEVC